MPFFSRKKTKKKTPPKPKKLTLKQQKITRQFVDNLKKKITKKKETEIDNTCYICLEKMKPSNTITLQCGHRFHKLCMYNNIVTSDVYNTIEPVYPYDWTSYGESDGSSDGSSDDSDGSPYREPLDHDDGNGSPPDPRTFIYKCPLCKTKITDPTILKELNRTGKKLLKKLYSENMKCELSRRTDHMKCHESWRTYVDANYKHNQFMLENGLIEESSPSSSLSSSVSSNGSLKA